MDDNKTIVHNYEYDKVGNRTVYERLENGVTKERYKYGYNDANQLVKCKNMIKRDGDKAYGPSRSDFNGHMPLPFGQG